MYIVFIKDDIMICRESAVALSVISPVLPFTFPFTPLINKQLSEVNFPIRVPIINWIDSCAFSPEAAAVISAKGLSVKTVVETVHSMAFFNAPGRLKTYSGVQMMTPSAASTFRLKPITLSGICPFSRSGLKCGREAIVLKISISQLLAKCFDRYLTMCSFEEFLRVLPIIAKICFLR